MSTPSSSKVSRQHGAWKALLHKYTAVKDPSVRAKVKPVTLWEISDPSLLDDDPADDDGDLDKVEDNEVDKDEHKGQRRRRRRRKKERRARGGHGMTVWKQFQLGISNLEVYPENSPVVEEVLQRMATDK